MGLKLKELQKVVKSVIREEKNAHLLREEVTKTFGPTILTSQGLEKMLESANDRLDILEATGKPIKQIRPSLLLKFADADSADVRKFVARMLPESFLKMMAKDPSPEVRAAVAARSSLSVVKEMIRRFPSDDTLRSIERNKRLAEAGLPLPEIQDEEFDMYGEMPLSDATADIQHPGLTDTWYETLALKIVNMYGRNIEQQWEEDTVHRYVDSMKSMGTDIDRDKLMQCVYDILERRDDEILKEGSLASIAARLRWEDTAFMPVIPESTDPVKALVSSGYSSNQYIEKFEELFSVQSKVTPATRFLGLVESSEKIAHPSTAKIPGQTVRPLDEKALDTYVKAWNVREQITNDVPYKLSWSSNPETINMVNFHLELK